MIEGIFAALAGVAQWLGPIVGGAVPVVAGHLEREQALEQARLQLEQQRIQAEVAAQQARVAAERSRTTMLVVGGVGAVAVLGFMLMKR